MRVRVSTPAWKDIDRLSDFLAQRNPKAANRALNILEDALLSLSELADRGYRGPREGSRQLFVPFGSAGYVVQYMVKPDGVTVLRIFHALEDR